MLSDMNDDELLDLFMRESNAEAIHLLREMLCDRMTSVINLAIEKYVSATSLPAYESRDDIRQDAYKAFIVKIDALKRTPYDDGIRDIRSYVYRLAKNECNGVHRRRQSRLVSSADVSEGLSSDAVVDRGLSPEQRLILKEDLTRYLRELERLPAKHRQVFMLGTHREYGPETVNLLVEMEICSAARLASLMGLSPDKCQGLSLPLTKTQIAVLIGKSEQEVAQLQEAALKRLKRRTLWELFGFLKK